MAELKVKSNFEPKGDQARAIRELATGLKQGVSQQVLLGVTGSGKTYTVAKVIEEVQKPTLIIAHNKTLAAQLCEEFKEFFPDNAVEYFVSYYDYYQPEAYIAQTDTYIEKDASINDEIEKLRHAATASLLERKDVIVVASVSAIYGLGSPEDYQESMVSIRIGEEKSPEKVMRQLIKTQYQRNDYELKRGTFRMRGDILEIFPSYADENLLRIEFFGDEVEKISELNHLTGKVLRQLKYVAVFPASHFVTADENLNKAIDKIKDELAEQLAHLKAENKLLEAQRLEQRTNFDLEMIQEMGYCQGIENYSRHLTGRKQGEAPYTLMDYFPDDFLLVIDESHVTLPQIRGMYAGDRARKITLIENGFRLPSALDNRPLRFEEFEARIDQAIYVSATPGDHEMFCAQKVVEQIIRPTGLLDPLIEVRPIKNQIDDLLKEIQITTNKGWRTLVTTLTKKMAEDLTKYLEEAGVKVRYLHSDIKTLERMSILRELRLGEFDVLVGINLLREGLDLPEVSFIAILDADKEGFLRAERSLIQTIGRAARNAEGRVIMYADVMTDSMKKAIEETKRRRLLQENYNRNHEIVPKTIKKEIRQVISNQVVAEELAEYSKSSTKKMSHKQREKVIRELEKEMRTSARQLEFERAAELRDLITELRKQNQKHKMGPGL